MKYKKREKIIPEAYNNIYNGWPWVNIEEIFKKVSDSAIPKLETVIGNNNNAEANIAGITPAVFIFKGKWDDSHRTFYFQLVFLDSLLIFFSLLSQKKQ